ncbi:SCO1664 family protein [Nocardioides fonticola]|uniref:SCO1664 family protein n=1 Tax=Nocardioides fonticola TaxID=450363 RepID=A0ABP7XWI7_9ACTN
MIPDPRPDACAVLREGDLELEGRIMPASNATFIGRVGGDGGPGSGTVVVYKPVSGERPLWDFPGAVLARREEAAYLVSEATGWGLVPPTVVREGPHGPGMVQLWCEPDPEQAAVTLVPEGETPEGYLHVFDGVDARDQPIALVHEDTVALRRLAVYDVVVNNADRKGGHVLEMPDGHRYGVDHGIAFHEEHKLRTVLWGWAGAPLTEEEQDVVRTVREAIGGSLGDALSGLLTDLEIDCIARRCDRLLAQGRLPEPREWPAIPWPPF